MKNLLKFAVIIGMFAIAGLFSLLKMGIKQTILLSGLLISDLPAGRLCNAITKVFGLVTIFFATSVKQLSAPRRSYLGVA